jgi:diguanylate cyclase (GGDEF)-like protein
MNKFIEYIKYMSYWHFIAFFVGLAIIISEVLIIIQSYIFYGEIRSDLIILGFITPAIDGLIIGLLVGLVFVKLKDKEAQLSQAEQFLLLSQKYGGIGTWQVDFINNTKVWSEVITQQLGFPDLAKPTWDDFVATIYPDDRNHVLKEVAVNIKEDKTLDVEYRIIDTQGKIRWMRSIGKAYFEPSNGNLIMQGTIQEITKQKSAEQEIEDLAYYDPLTRLPNRRLMIERIKHAMAASDRSGNQSALLFLDLDNFKMLNDTLGHDIGDILLQQVAARLTCNIRKDDTVSRFGGDEFVVLLEGLNAKPIEAATQAEDIAKKILYAINTPYRLASNNYTSSTSIGITLFNALQSEVKDLLKKADIAMYQAKQDGRNSLRFFDPQMQTTINARAELEKELNQAIEQQQFQLYYQIQVDSSLRPLGAEALIRWLHPQRGFISPANFIPLAESNGAILKIGQWVLDSACRQLNIWQQAPDTRNLTLSVNVSAKQFGQTDFISQVIMTIQQHNINPARLKLELTESLLQDNIEYVIAKMKELEDIGIQFSLDDFGTGYSSLQYLKQLPLYQLKIDKSFVDTLVINNSDQAIVRTIIAMAQSLGLSVIAEGVETKEQQQCLLTEGCDLYQGYLFGKPMPIDQFEALLKSN